MPALFTGRHGFMTLKHVSEKPPARLEPAAEAARASGERAAGGGERCAWKIS